MVKGAQRNTSLPNNKQKIKATTLLGEVIKSSKSKILIYLTLVGRMGKLSCTFKLQKHQPLDIHFLCVMAKPISYKNDLL